jgi:hypothetical protein
MSQCSIHIADHPDMLALAYQSGCRLSIGIESVNPPSLATVEEWEPSGPLLDAVRHPLTALMSPPR